MAEIVSFVCKACGAKIYPCHARCPSCGAREFDSEILRGEATLLTFTRVYALSLAFEDRFITLGMVEFENGLKALGRLFVDEPRVGMKLKAKIGTVRKQDGDEVQGLCFGEA